MEQRLTILVDKWMDGSISPSERKELALLLQAPAHQASLRQKLDDDLLQELYTLEPDARTAGTIQQHLMRAIRQQDTPPFPGQPTARVYSLRKWGWAAAVVFAICITTALIVLSGRHAHAPAAAPIASSETIQPGINKAILTVDNKTIDLATNKTGITVNNVISYNDGEKLSDAGELLILTTPRGGQYQAILPDGSKVWLDAASSIKFPSKFLGENREVEVTGQVYLEVAKNSKQPFKVKANGEEIQVLGTSFNIHAYEGDSAVKTTLIDGSVKVVSHQQPAVEDVVLKPGQQAELLQGSAGKIRVLTADLDQVLAWKNGYFSFEDITIQEMAKEIERWYDIRIVFEGKPVDMQLKGKMDRGVQLSDIIRFFKDDGFDTQLEGRTLVVTKK